VEDEAAMGNVPLPSGAVDDAAAGIAAGRPHSEGLAAVVEISVAVAGVRAVGQLDGVARPGGVQSGLDMRKVAVAVRLQAMNGGL
jgi:hypothetical protein